ncbi:MAG TPA: sigma-70 family RNA polymerase sigma factor [Anaerolineales bacterium]|nr:sigma-70 family RNA polymerase sigma factor [Anaerolineales bacterium]
MSALLNRQSANEAMLTVTVKSRRNNRADHAEIPFESLFQAHWTRLCQALYRLVGDWDEAEDLVLDAFVRLYRQPPQRQENLGGWLYRVATNLGLNALRARKRRRQYEEQVGRQSLENGSTAFQDPAEALERSQQQEAVRQALAQIKPRSAQLLLLRHSGLSYAELAAAVGIKTTSVGVLLARAEAEFADRYRLLDQALHGEADEGD